MNSLPIYISCSIFCFKISFVYFVNFLYKLLHLWMPIVRENISKRRHLEHWRESPLANTSLNVWRNTICFSLIVPPDQVHPVSIPHDELHQSTEPIWSEFGLDFFLISLEKAKKLNPKSDLLGSFSVRIWSETEKQSWCSTWLEWYVKKELMKEKHTSMLKKINLLIFHHSFLRNFLSNAFDYKNLSYLNMCITKTLHFKINLLLSCFINNMFVKLLQILNKCFSHY